ncbi:YhgE/Pip domain-containing protein [Georgenia faecalis]|uniref:YhgE/Pip domain-containing protein n=1 Tax=Georgenia faecalis TaxID=2483799 RepID=UPI000FDAE8D2|nr:YhgE/Pip domain-containing protein [Georgenia faecalis]
MIAIRLVGTELRRLTAGTMPRLALLAMILIPSLYSGLYLFANEDPYGRLGEVPAALVVEDRGATSEDPTDGTTQDVDYGKEVAERLLDGDGGFGWVETTRADAEAGVRSGRFDSALIIGPSFSQDLVSVEKYQPRQASLTLVTNDANNYLSTTISDTIVGEVRDTLAEEVGTKAADTFLQGFATVHSDLATAVEGTTRLVDGASQLSSGTAELVTGTDQLASGAAEAANGAARLSSGAGELSSSTARLAEGAASLASGLDTLRSRTRELPAQTRELADGAREVAGGTAEVAAVGDDAAAVARDVVTRVDAARADLEARVAALVADGTLTAQEGAAITTVLDDAREVAGTAAGAAEGAAGRLDALNAGASEVAAGAGTLAAATPELVQGIGTAASGGSELASGSAELEAGAGTVARDLGTLASGTAEVSEGAAELARSSVTLRDGTTELQSGLAELNSGLQEGLGRIPDLDEETREATARTLGNPVTVDKDTLARAGSYGAGLAPFFMSLAAWIGGYVLFLLVKPMSTRSLAADAPAWQTALGGWATPALIGVGQVALMFAVVAFALDITPVYAAGTVLILLLASAAFVAVLQALNVWLGAVGEFLGLVLMLVQLVTAGGTFPWQTIPEPLRSLHRMLPMSYTVEGLRQTLYGGDLATVARDIGVLAAVFLGGILATTYAAHRHKVWSPSRLQPELVL